MAWNYGRSIDTLVGGIVTVKILETSFRGIGALTSKTRSSKKKKSNDGFGFNLI